MEIATIGNAESAIGNTIEFSCKTQRDVLRELLSMFKLFKKRKDERGKTGSEGACTFGRVENREGASTIRSTIGRDHLINVRVNCCIRERERVSVKLKAAFAGGVARNSFDRRPPRGMQPLLRMVERSKKKKRKINKNTMRTKHRRGRKLLLLKLAKKFSRVFFFYRVRLNRMISNFHCIISNIKRP